jgi:hypothetical protein
MSKKSKRLEQLGRGEIERQARQRAAARERILEKALADVGEADPDLGVEFAFVGPGDVVKFNWPKSVHMAFPVVPIPQAQIVFDELSELLRTAVPRQPEPKTKLVIQEQLDIPDLELD